TRSYPLKSDGLADRRYSKRLQDPAGSHGPFAQRGFALFVQKVKAGGESRGGPQGSAVTPSTADTFHFGTRRTNPPLGLRTRMVNHGQDTSEQRRQHPTRAHAQ